VEIAVNKSKTAGIAPKYAIRSTVLSEEDLADVSDMEGLRSTLQISDLRGSDSGNVNKFIQRFFFKFHF